MCSIRIVLFFGVPSACEVDVGPQIETKWLLELLRAQLEDSATGTLDAILVFVKCVGEVATDAFDGLFMDAMGTVSTSCNLIDSKGDFAVTVTA